MKDFQRQAASQKRQKAREEAQRARKIDEIVKAHQGNHLTTQVIRNQPPAPQLKAPSQSAGDQKQLSELRAWIEAQMRNENMFSLVSNETDERRETTKDNSFGIFDNTAPKLVSIEVPSARKDPNKKAEQEKVKSKSRDRSQKSQKSEKSAKSQKSQKSKKSKQTQKTPKAADAVAKPKTPQKAKKLEHPLKGGELPGNRILSEEERAKLPNSRKNRYGVFPPSDGNTDFDRAVANQRALMKTQPKAAVVESDVSSIVQEEASESTEQNDLSDDSCDQVPVRQPSNQPFVSQRREILNQPASSKNAPKLPGVTNIKQQAEEEARRRRERETKAAITIQKWVRGHEGRKKAVQQREKISRQIEEDYGRFEREYKRSREYDLKRYLKDKKRLREKTGLKSNESIESIAEMIGDSSSNSKAKPSTIFDAMFKQRAQIDKDPLSLIAVYAKKHHAVPTHAQRHQQKDKHKQSRKTRTQTTSESIIEDYPDDFEDSVPKETSTIEEDLPSSKSSLKPMKVLVPPKQKGLVPAVGAPKFKPAQKKRTVKDSPAESIADEIIDEVPDSIKEDSIIEESGLDGSKNSVIRDEYENDNAKISEAKQKIEARNRIRFGLANAQTDERPKELVHKEAVILGMGEQREQMALQRQRILGDLLGEMKEYERAHISTAVMERMEKVVVTSMAQKDQMIMAQRLAELEREKRHQEEINRIREEQIKMLTQMMLLGFGQGSGQVLNDTQRQEALENVKKLVEKPITIKQETVHVNYSIQKVEAPIDVSLHDELANSRRSKKKTYLEEFDESKKDMASRSNDFSSSKKRPEATDDEIIDEVQASESQSIAEEIEQSRQSSQSASQSQSGLFRNNAFQEFKADKLRKAKGNDAHGMHQILSQIELAIIQEKEKRENELKSRLKKRKLTNKAYDSKVKELEKWVSAEKKDLNDRKSQVDYDYRNVKSLIGGFSSDRQALTDKIGVSPKRQRQSTLQSDQLEEDSRDSEGTREAIRQSQKLRNGLVADPEARYLEKKRQAAASLLEEKEKAIQQGLINRLAVYEEEETADELMKRALNMDVKAEINRRFEMAKKIIEDSGSIQDSVPSNIEKPGKAQKVVKFAPGLKADAESRNNHITEDSIQESVHGESISNSVRSNIVENRPRPTQSSSLGQRESSEVSSEYSEDFSESTEKESSSKNQKLQTMTKLQAKAKDLEESNAYSERFEEESIGQSQPQRFDIAGSASKMDSVKEESIDESIEVASKQSQPEQSNDKSAVIDSLPSEDVEVKDSGKSTDWQIQVAQAPSRKSSEAYTEDAFEGAEDKDEIEEDSDLNHREEIDDLQSCPDDTGKSQTDNLLSKADAIADELLKVILEGYKLEDKFELSAKVNQPDEDEFKDKFPWTLERVPEKPKEPEIIKKPEAPKRVKSERELADEKFKAAHQAQLDKLEERHVEVTKYLEFLCKRTDLLKLIESLNCPIKQDPLKVLKQIQAYEEDESSVLQNESDQKTSPQQILPYSFFCKVDREFVIMQRMMKRKLTHSQAEESDQLTVSQEDEENLHNIHHYALFEALNDALDMERPYRSKGQPMPWSNNSRTFKRITTQEQARKILEKAKDKVILIERTRAGTNLAPLPTVPAQTQDEEGNEVIPPPLSQGEEERRNMQRHQKLAQLMTEDIQENELQWVDYEVQDTQARFDLADMILHQLTGEIVSFLEAQADK